MKPKFANDRYKNYDLAFQNENLDDIVIISILSFLDETIMGIMEKVYDENKTGSVSLAINMTDVPEEYKNHLFFVANIFKLRHETKIKVAKLEKMIDEKYKEYMAKKPN